jgi:hypothetical protein
MKFPWLCALACAPAFGAPQLVIVNAEVFTADAARPRAEALAVEDGRFSAVGTNADVRALAGPATRVIDAGGRLVTPGLVEAHVHLASNLPLFPQPTPPLKMPGGPWVGPTPEQALAAVEMAVQEAAGNWIAGPIGQAVLLDPRDWRSALDAVSPERPVMLRAPWGHGTLLNSAALRRLGIAEDTKDPIGGWWGRRADGRLDGRAFEAAEQVGWERIAPADPARLASLFDAAAQRYARWGVTSIHLMDNTRTPALTADVLGRIGPRQKWTVYTWAGAAASVQAAWAALDGAPKALPARVRFDGPKWMLDGTPIEQLALQRQPYPGRPGWRGRANLSDAELNEVLQTALKRPGQTALHVVGDAATDRLLQTMKALAPPAAWAEKRLRLEHGDGLRPDTLALAAQLGVVVTQNPTHLPPPLPDGRPPRPPELLAPLRTLVKAGVPLALGSDAGGPEANPFFNILLATGWASAPAESLTREEALLAYTAGGAYAERQERTKGRIGPGLAADFALLSQNVLTVARPALPQTRSLLTVVDGEVIFEDPELASAAAKRP